VFVREELITHALAPHYRALTQIRTRKQLHASSLWPTIAAEVARVTSAVERADHERPREDAETVRLVAWNIQRGRSFDAVKAALTSDARLGHADVICLVEVDSGMGRSGNRNVARELAAALGMSYAFGVSYLVLEDDWGENPQATDNHAALAGTAILSRLPIVAVENVDLPELRDKFSSREKRLGKKRALVCKVQGKRPLTVAACHLDSNASPRGRAEQLAALLARAEHFAGAGPLVVGGDFNTTTYDLSSPLALARNLLHKLVVTGFAETVNQYMTPELLYEKPVFEVLRAHGLAVDELNDRAHGTLHFDINDEYAHAKSKRLVGTLLTRLLAYKLKPWNGRVPARLDWFAGRGVTPLASAVVDLTHGSHSPGAGASDHAAVVVDLRL
jgi:endonuclease/exonuclease/phosphatase family metal-dependent hydrolase